MKHLITPITVCPEPLDPVRPELVEGTNGAQDRLVEGPRCHASSWFDKPVPSYIEGLTTNGMRESML